MGRSDAEVGVDLLDRAPLIAGELEGQRLKPAGDQLAGSAQGDAGPARLAALAARGERRLVQEELLEGEPIAGPFGLVEAGRKVGDRQRITGARQLAAGAKLRRQRLERVARQRLHLPRPLAQPLGAQPLRGGMDRDDAGRVEARGAAAGAPWRRPVARRQEFVRLDPKAGAVELPVEQAAASPPAAARSARPG